MVPGRQMEHHKQQLTVGSCKPEPKKDLWNSEQPARWPRDEYHVLRGKVWLSADYLEETIIDACLAPFFWAVDFQILGFRRKTNLCHELSWFKHSRLPARYPTGDAAPTHKKQVTNRQEFQGMPKRNFTTTIMYSYTLPISWSFGSKGFVKRATGWLRAEKDCSFNPQ